MAACSAAAATCLCPVPFHHFLRPANAELVSGGPFPCSFDGTRYQRGPPMVRNMRAVLKKASSGTRRVFRSIRCKKQASTVRKRYSVHENPIFLHGRRFLRNSVRKTGFYGTEGIFGTGTPFYGTEEIFCLSLKKVDSQQRVNNGVFTHPETVQLL